MAINLTTKYSPLVDKRFTMQSITDAYAGKKYEWDGAQSIKVYSIDRTQLNDYNRTAAGGRFGNVTELGDGVQTMTLTQDKSFTFSIDHGNAADQLNIKRCNEQLKSNWDEVCTPAIDKYRLAKWIDGAGQGAVNATALTKSTIISAIMTAGAALSNKLVPKKNRVLFIRESLYIECKLSTEIVGLDKPGEKAVINGVVGTIDGMAVVPVPDSYFPSEHVNFLIKYKDSTADPMKLKTMRVQKNPIGYDADVGECRFYHDSFVLGNKADGLYVHAKGGVAAAVTFSATNNTITLASSGNTIKYTTDGTNPKTSDSAQVYSSAIAITANTKIKAYAYKAGSINSAVTEYDAVYSAS